MTAAVLIIGMGVVGVLTLQLRQQLIAATDSFVDEQRVADRIVRAVMRQLAVSSALPSSGSDLARQEFQDAGEILYEQVRRYLFRDLSAEERLQLEEIREEQQRLEVAAARASDLFSRGLVEEAEASRDAMIGHAFDFLGAMEAFLRLREAELEALQVRQTTTITILFGGVALLGLLLVFGPLYIGSLLNHRVARPIQQLAAASGRLEAGELSVRVPPGEDLEFRILSDGFNRMAEGLEKMTRDLEARNDELAHALQELRTTQDELIQAEKLGAMGRMAAGLAHELNNPLATVLGYSQLLAERLDREKEDSWGRELRRDFLGPIVQEAERAQHLVRNFLYFARKPDMKLGSIHLKEAFDVVTALRKYSFQQIGLELEVVIDPGLHVRAEPQMLQSVLLNLVTNAMDAMAPAGKGSLRVTAERADGWIRVTFQDSGPGLSDPDRVFEPFYTTKPPGQGTGLGLALTHRFMTLFGGHVTAENVPTGGGLFTLVFPEGLPPSAEVRDGEAGGFVAPVAQALQPGSPDATRTVLVVEDEAPLRRLQERALKGLNVHVLLADSAAEARRLLAAHQVDAIVCDVKMPGESGLSFFAWLRETNPDLAEHLVFVTGDAGHPDLQELMEKNPHQVLWKPFQMDEYRSRVLTVLGGIT
ncbi:MAG: ATP-binding protein [Gemmatimonadota bacterium]